MKKGDLLFVYGTLRKGERADLSRNPEVTYLGEDRINGQLFNLGWYPGVKAWSDVDFMPGFPSVHGDVFRLENDNLHVPLDLYEGHPEFFHRIPSVNTEKGLEVWVYNYPHEVDPDKRIDSGDWRQQ